LAVSQDDDRFEWVEAAPEGFLAASPGIPGLGHWQMAGHPVDSDPIWKALQLPQMLAKAVRGEKLPMPKFGK
jgi:hypothetical protein